MAELVFNYGAMNSGKSTQIIQAIYNYEERGLRVLLIKPKIDTKGDETILSRAGLSRKVDILLNEKDSLLATYHDYLKEQQCYMKSYYVNCLLIDEAQFLTEEQVIDAFILAKKCDLKVVCYGLRTDFQGNMFPGSERLLGLSDRLNELQTICRCGEIARFNGRMVNGIFVSKGEQVAIDEQGLVTYESLCGKCYLEKIGVPKILKKKLQK